MNYMLPEKPNSMDNIEHTDDRMFVNFFPDVVVGNLSEELDHFRADNFPLPDQLTIRQCLRCMIDHVFWRCVSHRNALGNNEKSVLQVLDNACIG